MLLVKTKLKESDLHGIGLYADQFIPKGTEIWRFTPGFDVRFTDDEILAFPELLQTYLCKYTWKSKQSGLYCLASDSGKHFNHSDNPNVLSEQREDEIEVVTIALRDILADEELADDYASFEDISSTDNVLDKIAQKFNLHDELNPWLK